MITNSETQEKTKKIIFAIMVQGIDFSHILHKAVDSSGMLGTVAFFITVFTTINPILEFVILLITLSLGVVKLYEKWVEHRKKRKANKLKVK